MTKIVSLCLLIYVLGFASSFMFDLNQNTYTTYQTQKIDTLFNDMQNKSSIDRFKKIASNNLFVICVNIIGALSFGGITLLNTFYNGFIFGYIIKITMYLNDASIFHQRITPHSFEIIAIILSSIIGLYYGNNIFFYLTDKKFKLANRQRLVNLYLIPICVFLTIFFAFIEAYVSMG